MPSQRSPFNDEYRQGSETSATQETEVGAPVAGTGRTSTSLTEPPGTALVFEPERYGTGKPRRVVIRGKISRD